MKNWFFLCLLIIAAGIPGKPAHASCLRQDLRAGSYIGDLGISTASPSSDTIKIMPVGNSITAGEHYGFPALEERTGYRKALYEMLIENGYNVDFVGSQKHGIRPEDNEDWYDWNCEAYPGWKIPDIASKVDTALKIYHPDILLVHVGTNGSDWEDKPLQVMEMLERINDYAVQNDQPITVFLCLIIKRFIEEDPAPTTRFNEDVKKLVHSRSNDKIRIILVDMENGAGLDYSDNLPDPNANPPYEGGDMLGYRYPGVAYDKYHPNDKGNRKMASLLYQKLENYLNSITGYTPVSVTGVSIDSTEITLETGNSQLLHVVVEPSDATDKRVTWESSNTEVATVSLNGSVKAIGPGSATITVTTNEGMYTDSCVVNVLQAIGISSIMSEQGMRVYPNPFKDRISTRFEEIGNIYSLEILSITGQVVKQLEKHDLQAGFVELDLEVPGNIFLVRMNTDKKVYTGKIIRK